MDKLRGQREALQKLEGTAAVNEPAKSFWRSQLVGEQVFCREVFLRLLEVRFKTLPADLPGDLVEFSGSHLSSLLVEYIWSGARKKASLNRAGRLGPVGLWHAAV